MKKSFDQIMEEIQEKDLRYKRDAYVFAMEALTFTQEKFKAEKHVSGEEMLEGIRDLLIKKFGPMTLQVLKHWGIKTTEDFGNIIFTLVENKVLSKNEDDNIETFRNAYDLEEVFDHGYRRQLNKKISRMRSIK